MRAMAPSRWVTRTVTAPVACLLALALAASMAASIAAPAARADALVPTDEGSVIVNPDPVDWTPNVLDGAVTTIVRAGALVIAGGTFTKVEDAGSDTVLVRHHVFAFDGATGAISTTFAPRVNGEVTSLAASLDGASVFVGGLFTKVNGKKVMGLVKLNVTTGARVKAFSAATNAEVRALAIQANRLYVGGAFTTIRGVARSALAAVDTISGAVDASFDLPAAGTLFGQGSTSVIGLEASPDGTRLVAIGNFATIDGLRRVQIAMIDLTGAQASVANWATADYSRRCVRENFTYMRAVSFAPDGSYFVVVTTGGGRFKKTLCDTASRWQANATGTHLHPMWKDYTGGDTLLSVEVSDAAVYVGGHQRWENNARVTNHAVGGAVDRPGIAALDPVSGVPFRWNPTKDRGEGTSALLATPAGLLVGSDTTELGHEYHARIGMFPNDGGETPPDATAPALPGTLFEASAADQLTAQFFDGAYLGSPSTLATPGIDWTAARGAFAVAGTGTVYAAWSDGNLYAFAFDGSTFGAPVDVIGAAGYVDGHWISFANATGMFYDAGRLYYTRSGDRNLYYRFFAPESGIIGTIEYIASGSKDGLDWSGVRGMTEASGHVFYGTADGNLHVMTFTGGTPVPGTDDVLSGPGIDGRNWSSNGLFVVDP
jgi:hypothetical protein